MNKDTSTGIRNVLIFFAAFAIIALVGTTESIAIIPITTVLCGGLAHFFKKNTPLTISWAAIGFIAGIAWHTFGV